LIAAIQNGEPRRAADTPSSAGGGEEIKSRLIGDAGRAAYGCSPSLLENYMKTVQAPCSTCIRRTKHDVLFETTQQDEETLDTYVMISCGGCSTISMGHQRQWLDDGKTVHFYYPSPVSRRMPSWMFWLSIGLVENDEEGALGALLTEIFQAVDGGQYRLAAMGIRALLEQVMISKIGDLATFDQKLDEFQKQGYISLLQRDSMRATLHVGDAAMHRGFVPTEQELNVALDVVEGVFAPIFGHRSESEKLTDRVPPRAPRSPKKP
jgi:hypothetical protein